MDYREVNPMAVGGFGVSPVERNQLPLVVRRNGVQDQQQKQKNPYEQAHSDGKEEKKGKEFQARLLKCIVESNRVDCKI